MNFAGWEPFREMLVLRDTMDRFLAEAFGPPPTEWVPGLQERLVLDMYETKSSVRVEVPLPGLKRDEIDVHVAGRLLTITGEKHVPSVPEAAYQHHELHSGAFTRSVELPDGLDTDHPLIKLEDGILDIIFTKLPEGVPTLV